MGKFNANSLSYSQNLPPFLAKLQGQYNNDHQGQRADPILAAQRRAAKKRSASEEAEDAPLVLDDNGDVIDGVTFGKDGAATMEEKEGEDGGTTETARLDGKTAVDAVAGIGAGKKKKIGRVIGGESDGEDKDDDDNKDSGNADRKKRKRPARDDNDGDNDDKTTSKPKGSKDQDVKKSSTGGSGKDKDKKKKKARKVQLSFEDDEDEG